MSRFLSPLLAGLLLVAGCTATVQGAPTSRSSEGKSEPLTSAAFGDLSTIDPCGLTGPAAFEQYGSATMPGRASLDSCRVSVATGEGKVVVEIGLLQQPETLAEDQREVRNLPRGASIKQTATQSAGLCTMVLVLADDVSLLSSAAADDPEAVSDTVLCGVAQGGAEGAYQVADGDRVKHWEPPQNSLATVPACDLLPAEQVASQLGITTDRIARYPAGHQCRWGRTGGDTATAKLDFSVALDAYDAGAPDGEKPEPVGGRPSWVVDTPTSEILVCSVLTEHIEFDNGVGEREYATLRVAVPVTAGKDPCVIGRALAGTGWTKLPAA